MKKMISVLILTFAVLFLSGCTGRKETDESRQTLILATLFDDPFLSEAVTEFNKQNSSLQIEIQNYMDDAPELRDAVNKIKMEIVSGGGPDLVNFGIYYSAGDASDKILQDLNVFMTQDKQFHKDSYFYNVWDSFSNNGSLNVLIPNFRIRSFATASPKLMEKTEWNMEELIEYFQTLPEETSLFPGETKISVFGFLCTGGIENYINWDTRTCSFNSKSFQNLLRFSDQFPLRLDFSEDTSVREEFSHGRALLYPVSVDSVFTTSLVTALLGKANYIGYPMDTGNGSIAEINNLAIGIAKNCKNREGAWQFLKDLLKESRQDKVTGGLPINRNSLNRRLKEAMQPEFSTDGEKLVRETFLFEGEESIPVYQITEEDADTLLSLIGRITHNASLDRELYNIVIEEADFFFHQERSAEDTAEIIQRRATVLINESM